MVVFQVMLKRRERNRCYISKSAKRQSGFGSDELVVIVKRIGERCDNVTN